MINLKQTKNIDKVIKILLEPKNMSKTKFADLVVMIKRHFTLCK